MPARRAAGAARDARASYTTRTRSDAFGIGVLAAGFIVSLADVSGPTGRQGSTASSPPLRGSRAPAHRLGWAVAGGTVVGRPQHSGEQMSIESSVRTIRHAGSSLARATSLGLISYHCTVFKGYKERTGIGARG
jgi:hypothetical protein